MIQPLASRRILVTRGASQASKLSEGLRKLGANPVEVPLIEIVPPESYEPFDEALRNLAQYDWLILTSANTIEAISERSQRFGVNPANVEGLSIAAVGKATSDVAKHYGFRVSVVAKAQVAEGVVEALKDRVSGRRVLLARAAVARDVIPDSLRAAGATVDVVDAYRNVVPSAAPQQLRHAYARGLDAVTFTSSSSVTHLAQAAQGCGLPFPFPYLPAISIGPITSQTLRDLRWPPVAEADPHDIPGLIEAVARYFAPAS